MKIGQLPLTVTDWAAVPKTDHPGQTGMSSWRAFEREGLRVRVVEYSAGFRSDHWCPRGHVLFVLEGEFGIELKDGRNILMEAGMSFQAGDDETNPHLAYSEKGARVFIVD